ncbi:hypothetical protein AB0J47_28905 [Nocardia sp. NPDC049737]|uniref:hypothetical protein n=1 Tax=Nocardia sp. NPDC049737 TaxID=3154358 RepID=UPI00341CFCEA
MTSSLVVILWPSSLFFTAVACFRIGKRWKSVHPPDGRGGEFISCHRDDEDHYCHEENDTQPMKTNAAQEFWVNEDDTEILPRLQDIVPPLRQTPIRRPPWLHGRS